MLDSVMRPSDPAFPFHPQGGGFANTLMLFPDRSAVTLAQFLRGRGEGEEGERKRGDPKTRPLQVIVLDGAGPKAPSQP